MAKHNNTEIYNYDTPSLRTALLGFRPNNAKRSRNYEVADIASLIIQQLGLAYGNAIISGSVVWDEGLQYTATNLMYIIEGTIYEAEDTTVTLSDADPTLSRIDVIYTDTDGNVGVLEGQAAVDPVQPVIDNQTQVLYTFVLIGPGATEPTGVGEDIIYSDNLVTDWANETTSVTQVDFDNTNYINSGTKNIYIKDLEAGESLTFTSDTVLDFNDVSSLNFRIQKIDSESTEIRIYFLDEDDNFSSSINLTSGNYGFDGTNTTTYQNINLPKTLFTGLTEIKKLVMSNSSSSTLEVALDDIRLVTGVYNPPSFGNFLNLLDTPNTYSGHGGKYVRVKISEDGLEFVSDPDDPTPTENIYNTIAEMLADQGNQTEEYRQKVLDASADPEVTSGRAYYIKQASNTANLTADYERISEADAEILDVAQGLETIDCGSTIPLNTVKGHFCNMGTPNGNTSFVIDNLNLIGAFTVVKINVSQTDLDNAALTEPNISEATQQGGVDFVADTDMELLIQNRGATGLIYSYLPVTVSELIDEDFNIPPNTRGKVYGWYPNIDFANQYVGNNGWTQGGSGSQLAPTYSSSLIYETWHRRQLTGTEIYLYEDTVSIGAIGRGFYYICQFAMVTPSSASNVEFIGLYGLGSVIGNVNPSGLTNIIGLALDDSDTNYQFIHNDGSGTATKIDLGSDYDRDQAGNPYSFQLEMYCAPGTSEINYRVRNLDNSASDTGWNSITTELPAATVGLYPQIYANIGTGASANNVKQLGFLEVIRYQ